MLDADCDLCGETGRRVVFAAAKERFLGLGDAFDVVACVRCGHVYTDPQPLDMTRWYPDGASYFTPRVPDVGTRTLGQKLLSTVLAESRGNPTRRFFPRPVARLAAPFFERALRLFPHPGFVPGGRLLDLGCAFGERLYAFKAVGWNVTGLDAHGPSVRFARETLGLDVRRGSLDEPLPFPESDFDVVVASMALEHVRSPSRTLAEIVRILKPGGRVFLAVPDFSGLEFRLFKDRCYALQVPQHLHHFTPPTLLELLGNSGLRLVRLDHCAVATDVLESLKLLDLDILKRLGESRSLAAALGPIMALLARFHLTSRFTIEAVKPTPPPTPEPEP